MWRLGAYKRKPRAPCSWSLAVEEAENQKKNNNNNKLYFRYSFLQNYGDIILNHQEEREKKI